MATNNLRILYQNLADSGTITPSSNASASTASTNLIKDSKSLVWRSSLSTTTAVKANLVVTFASATVGGILLPFCNLTTAATIRVRGYTGAAPVNGTGTVDLPTVSITGTQVFDTGVVVAAPYPKLQGASYTFGGGTYGRVWLSTPVACTSILIEITDTNTDRYVEVSRLVIGNYWSPTYNTAFGLSSALKDMSSHSRTESGDLITTVGVRYKALNFDLAWLDPADRQQLTSILKYNGMSKPMFISLFPNCTEDWDKEHTHQIYGKLSQVSDITHPMFGIYSSTVEIEEV